MDDEILKNELSLDKRKLLVNIKKIYFRDY